MGMSFELMVLTAASLWGFLQLVAAAQVANAQYGLKWAASSRDVEMPPLKPIPGRINRNFRNYMETFPFFAAAVLTAQAAGVHNELTYWGSIAYIGGRIAYTALYVSGIPLIRSLFWNIAAFGMLAVLAAPFFPR
ncbi:MAPEG family protein [Bradyrhizobium sp. CNPSo 4026]|nr:MAPEG family protein [Bradyrhizobium cenepequi]